MIVAADLSRAALELGVAAARRYAVDHVHFVETDLHRPGLKPASFDIVYSSGVLHHTPSPRLAFAALTQLVRPGGIVIAGVYNTLARVPLRLRRAVARFTRFRLVPFDPVLRDRRHEPARRDAWLRDQYQHPEEHCHTVAEIKRWLSETNVEYLRTFPSTVLEDESGDLFARDVDDWTVERWIAQLGWMWTLGGEGGLFLTIGRRR
jgi:SAM-dependent methyltransferase